MTRAEMVNLMMERYANHNRKVAELPNQIPDTKEWRVLFSDIIIDRNRNSFFMDFFYRIDELLIILNVMTPEKLTCTEIAEKCNKNAHLSYDLSTQWVSQKLKKLNTLGLVKHEYIKIKPYKIITNNNKEITIDTKSVYYI